jgi:hypothetical protein
MIENSFFIYIFIKCFKKHLLFSILSFCIYKLCLKLKMAALSIYVNYDFKYIFPSKLAWMTTETRYVEHGNFFGHS